MAERYVLYDLTVNKLLQLTCYADRDEAEYIASQCNDVLVLPLEIPGEEPDHTNVATVRLWDDGTWDVHRALVASDDAEFPENARSAIYDEAEEDGSANHLFDVIPATKPVAEFYDKRTGQAALPGQGEADVFLTVPIPAGAHYHLYDDCTWCETDQFPKYEGKASGKTTLVTLPGIPED